MQINIKRNIPDFYVVGAAKSGTTSLWYYLGQHPGIFMTKDVNQKELGYFCHHYGVESLETYSSFFNDAKDHQLIGEVCHSYLSSPESAEWIHRYNPKAKIIVILRNPTNRAYSLYNWMVTHGYEYAASFEKALQLEEHRINAKRFRNHDTFPAYFRNYAYFNSGLYCEQVRRYIEIFGRENCYFTLFEEFRKDVVGSVTDILNFLNLPLDLTFNTQVQNESSSVRSPIISYHLKHNYYRLCQRLLIPHKVSRLMEKRIKLLNIIPEKPKKINLTTAQLLQKKYAQDIVKTGDLIEKDTASWLHY